MNAPLYGIPTCRYAVQVSDAPEWPARGWLTASELATVARVADRTILREIDRGHLTATKAGRAWIIDLTEAQRWLTDYRKTGPRND